jgi:hypothetical protein
MSKDGYLRKVPGFFAEPKMKNLIALTFLLTLMWALVTLSSAPLESSPAANVVWGSLV